MEHTVEPTAPFVGRTEELAALGARLDAARAGSGGLVLLAGEPGIGKTRLAEQLAAAAQGQGVPVLWGRCYEGEGAPAFWPWIEPLRSLIRQCDAATLATALGSGASAIAQLVPELEERLPGLAPLPPLAPDQARFRLFEAVTSFLKSAAAPSSLVLILDDLHWADTPSLLLLQFLARELRQSRLLVIGIYRDVAVGRGHPLAQALAGLVRAHGHQRIVLRGLNEGDVARYMASVAGREPPAELAGLIAAETDGNPFFLTQVMLYAAEVARRLHADGSHAPAEERAAWTVSVPQSVREVIWQRLDQLSAVCNQVLTIAAVAGREFRASVVERAGDLPPHQVLEALEEAEAAHVIAAVPDALGRYRFAHALIRETIYTDLPRSRRVRLHRQVGEALEALAGATTADLEELAHHFVEAAPGGDVAKAIAYARQAGDRARTLCAYEEGARHYQMALQALELQAPADDAQRCDLLLALGDAQNAAGEIAEAQATLGRAAEIARRLRSPERLARAALAMGGGSETAAGDAALVALLEEALQGLGSADSAVRARVLARLARALSLSAAHERGRALSAEAVQIARRIGDPPTLTYALHARQVVAWSAGTAAERLLVADEMLRAAEAAGDLAMTWLGRTWRLVAYLEQGDMPAVDAELTALARLVEEVRQPVFAWSLSTLRAMRALLDGHFAEAEHQAQQALALGQRTGYADAVAGFALQLFALRREQGRLAELEPLAKSYVERYPALLSVRCALAVLYMELDRVEDARREFDRVTANALTDLPEDGAWLLTLVLLAELAAYLGDVRHAALLYPMLLPYAGRIVVLGAGLACTGSTSRYLGLLAATLRGADPQAAVGWEDAAAHFEDALAMHTRMAARPLVARSQYDYAAMLVGQLAQDGAAMPGDRALAHVARARDLQQQALAAARDLGMARLAEQAAALHERLERLAQAQRRPPQPKLPAGLTRREVEVLQLLVAGRTNREIAATLFVSVPTVERHLATIYAKIGARGRAEAAAFAVRHGLASTPEP